jgi:flagellar protein FliS
MALNNPYAQYRQTQTSTASQIQLIVMLHDGAIRHLAKAAEALAKKDYSAKAEAFGKAFKIIEHLCGTLDKENGGDLAKNLEQIYAYMHERLMQANLRDDFGPIKEVINHLRGMRESWAGVDSILKKDRPTALKQPYLDPSESDAFEMAA